MALSYPIVPATYAFSQNPIIVEVATNIVDLGYVMPKVCLGVTVFGIEYIFESDIDEGYCHWNIAEILNKILDGNIANKPIVPGINVITCSDTLMPYSLHLFEVYGIPSVVDHGSAIFFTGLFVVKGGLSDETFTPELYWSNRADKAPLIPFLTWYPNNKIVRPFVPESLSYLPYLPTGDDARLVIRMYDYTTNNYIHDYVALTGITIRGYVLTAINVSPSELGILNLDNTEGHVVGRYDVWLENENTREKISETRSYIIDYGQPKALRFFSFINSLGGYDIICCTGEVTTSPEFERSESSYYKNFDFWNLFNGTSRVNEAKEIYTEKVNTGFLTTTEADWFRDFFLATVRWVWKMDRWIPIKLISKKLDILEPNDTLSHTFEYAYAYKNNVYTPKQLT